jgi:hypothetical protein
MLCIDVASSGIFVQAWSLKERGQTNRVCRVAGQWHAFGSCPCLGFATALVGK